MDFLSFFHECDDDSNSKDDNRMTIQVDVMSRMTVCALKDINADGDVDDTIAATFCYSYSQQQR